MDAAKTQVRRRRDGALSRAEIIAAAMEISSEQGTAAVTFRALGARLGVAATAVYRHFRDKDELMLALGDQVFVEIAERFRPTGDWVADLRQLAELGRVVGRRHAFAAAWLGYRNTGGPGDQGVALATLRTLRASGLTQEQTLFYYELFTDTLMGLLAVDAMRATLDADSRRKDDDALAALYATIAREEPELARLPAIAVASNEDRLFAAQVQLYIDAVQRCLAGNPVVASPY